MKEIAADYISRRVKSPAVGELNHCRVGIGVRIRGAGVSRINSDIMTRKPFDQLALRCDRPFFQMRRQPVCMCENKICNTGSAEFFGPLGGADESSNHNSERRR